MQNRPQSCSSINECIPTKQAQIFILLQESDVSEKEEEEEVCASLFFCVFKMQKNEATCSWTYSYRVTECTIRHTHSIYIYTYIWSPSPSHTGVVFVVSCFSLQFACSSLFSHLLLPSCEDLWWRWIFTNTVWWGTGAYFSFCARFDLKDEVSPVMKGLVMTQTCAGFAANDLENKLNKTYKTHFDLLRLFLWDLRVLKGWRAPTSIQCAFKRRLWIIIKP